MANFVGTYQELPNTITYSATQGRVATVDLEDADIVSAEVITQPSYGHASINPDGTMALVLTGETDTDPVMPIVRITHTGGGTLDKAVAASVIEGTQGGGWGLGEFYKLETDAQDRIVVEHGVNHRKVYVSGSPSALSVADIAVIEGLPVEDINQLFFLAHPEYGATPEMAVAEDAAQFIWIRYSGQTAGPNSNWLLFERGYTYSTLAFNPNKITGESEIHPVYVGAYGTGADPITSVRTQFVSAGTKNVVVQDIHFANGFSSSQAQNIVFDNITSTGDVFNIQNIQSFTLRNSAIHHVARETPVNDTELWAPHINRISGVYMTKTYGALFENSLYDHNGWGDGYREDLLGTSPQPPSKYSHNLYLAVDNLDVTVRDNIIMRAAGDGLQLRCGGYIEDNLILDNNGGGFFGKGGTPPLGNYSLFTGNVRTSGGHRNADEGISVLSGGWISQADLSILRDNIIAHLADPNNPSEKAAKTTTNWALEYGNGTVPLFDNTIIYNWEGAGAAAGLNDQNLGSLDTEVLDQTTIQLFTADLLEVGTATIEDFSAYLLAQPGGHKLGGSVTADYVNDFFRANFGLDTTARSTATTLRFIPNDLVDGVRWDNRMNWSTGDLPGTVAGDSVDLGGNKTRLGGFGTLNIANLTFGKGGSLVTTCGRLNISGTIMTESGGAGITITRAGQVWITDYSDSDTLTVTASSGRFAVEGSVTGVIDMSVSGNAQALLATTDGGDWAVGDGSITITGSDCLVGFDGEGAAAVSLTLGASSTLTFVADADGFGQIAEVVSGAFGTPSKTGTVTLNGKLVLDPSALTTGNFRLLDVTTISGTFASFTEIENLSASHDLTITISGGEMWVNVAAGTGQVINGDA